MIWLCVILVCANSKTNGISFDERNYFLHSHRKLQSLSNVDRSSSSNGGTSDNFPVFPALGNYDVNADPVPESKYKWIARVVHSRSAITPHMCTASCIANGIFITAAACISRLKVYHTTIIYEYDWLPVTAFVIPANSTRQSYDDIGFIIVSGDVSRTWNTIKIFDNANRTDDNFRWFSELFHTDEMEHKVIGFSIPRSLLANVITDKQYYLSELPVVVNFNLCSSILPFKKKILGYEVPCYHSCTVSEYESKKDICNSYHGVEGGALINTKTNVLIGIATWGSSNAKSLPVGFAVPNSENFFKNYECAKRISNVGGDRSIPGHYQSICNDENDL